MDSAGSTLGLTVKTLEVVPGSVGEGPHGVVVALLHQPHRLRPQQQSNTGGAHEV